jgi:hypothetical protein
MKPDELEEFKKLPDKIIALRAHRENAVDWMSYTLSPERATMFANQRGSKEIVSYSINKSDVVAYFTRRGEFELIVLHKAKASPLNRILLIDKN